MHVSQIPVPESEVGMSEYVSDNTFKPIQNDCLSRHSTTATAVLLLLLTAAVVPLSSEVNK